MSWDVPANPQEALARKRADAKAAVYKVWTDKLQDSQGNPKRDGMTDAEKTQMGREVEVADAKAILEYVMQKLLLTLQPAAVGLQTTTGPGSPTGPPAAPIPLTPGVAVNITFLPG